MKRTFASLLILAVAFVSCQKASEAQQESPAEVPAAAQQLTITATINDVATKVSFEQVNDNGIKLRPTWEVGDEVFGIIDGVAGSKVTFTVESVASDGTASLKVKDGSTPIQNGKVVQVVYAPGYSASDINGTSLNVNFSSQSGKVPAVMTASATVQNGAITLGFTNKMAVLGLTQINGFEASKQINRVTVLGDNMYTTGTVDLSSGDINLGSKGTITWTGSVGTNSGTTSDDIYIAMFPATTSISIQAFTGTGNSEVTYTSATISSRALSSKYYYTSRQFTKVNTFTINANGDKVTLAPGNLYYVATGEKWYLHSNSMDCFGSATNTSLGVRNGNLENGADVWDLFAWPTVTSSGYGNHTSRHNLWGHLMVSWDDSYWGTFNDWGSGHEIKWKDPSTNQEVTYQPGYWFTLSQADWVYILFDRPQSNRYEVLGNGLKVFYDGSSTEGVSLPAAGCRVLVAYGGAGGGQSKVNDACTYWTSTSLGGASQNIGGKDIFLGKQVNTNAMNRNLHEGANTDGAAVRLAHRL